MTKSLHDLARILATQLIIVLALLGLALVGYSYRKSLLITYHRLGSRSALKAMRRAAAPTMQPDRFNKHADRVGRHQDALIRLGYLEEQRFQTRFLTVNAPQTQALLEEHRRKHPDSSFSVSWGKALTIVDRPERMPTWESLVRKYDVPPDDPNEPAQPEASAERG